MGDKYNTYSVGDVDLTNIMEVLDAVRQGYHKVSLTEWDTTTKPEIAQGSKIEVNGAFFVFDVDEAISGTPADGVVYIKLTPSGDTISAAFTSVAPIWDTEKGGWYEPATNNRYLNYAVYKSGSSYYNKYPFSNIPEAADSFLTFPDPTPLKEINTFYLHTSGVGSILATESVGSGAQTETKDFYILKPITYYIDALASVTHTYLYLLMLNPGVYRLHLYSGVTALCTIYAYQNSDWREVVSFEVVGGGNGFSATLYLTGVFGVGNIIDLDKIRTLL